MDDYISRDKAIEVITPDHETPTTLYGKGYYDARIHAVEMLKFMKATELKPLDDVLQQIADLKKAVKSENSDYLTGYISALSAVEGMIAEKK